VTQDNEYMDTGALTDDAVPQPPVEAPDSPADSELTGPEKAALLADKEGQPQPADSEKPESILPEGAYAVPAEDATDK